MNGVDEEAIALGVRRRTRDEPLPGIPVRTHHSVDTVDHGRVEIGPFENVASVRRKRDVCVYVADPSVLVEQRKPLIDTGSFAEVAPAGLEAVCRMVLHAPVITHRLSGFIFRRRHDQNAVEDRPVHRQRVREKIRMVNTRDDGFKFHSLGINWLAVCGRVAVGIFHTSRYINACRNRKNGHRVSRYSRGTRTAPERRPASRHIRRSLREAGVARSSYSGAPGAGWRTRDTCGANVWTSGPCRRHACHSHLLSPDALRPS